MKYEVRSKRSFERIEKKFGVCLSCPVPGIILSGFDFQVASLHFFPVLPRVFFMASTHQHQHQHGLLAHLPRAQLRSLCYLCASLDAYCSLWSTTIRALFNHNDLDQSGFLSTGELVAFTSQLQLDGSGGQLDDHEEAVDDIFQSHNDSWRRLAIDALSSLHGASGGVSFSELLTTLQDATLLENELQRREQPLLQEEPTQPQPQPQPQQTHASMEEQEQVVPNTYNHQQQLEAPAMHEHFLRNEARTNALRMSVYARRRRAALRLATSAVEHSDLQVDMPIPATHYTIELPPDDNMDRERDMYSAAASNERLPRRKVAWNPTSSRATPPDPPTKPADEQDLDVDLLLKRGSRADASDAERRAVRHFWAARRRAACMLAVTKPPRLHDAQTRAQLVADALPSRPSAYMEISAPAAMPAWRANDLARQRSLDQAVRNRMRLSSKKTSTPWCDDWQKKPSSVAASKGLPFTDDPYAARPADAVPRWAGARERGRSRVHESARVGDAPTLARLLSFAGDIFEAARQPDGHLVTPLHLACRCAPDAKTRGDAGALACAQLLLSSGASPGAATAIAAGGETSLHLACARGCALLAEELLACERPPTLDGGDDTWEPANVAAIDANGQTPLHRAVNLGGSRSRACVELLLAHGADITVQDVDGANAVHIACARCDVTLLKMLLRGSQNLDLARRAVTTLDHQLRTPLHRAISFAADGGADRVRRAASDSPKPSAFARCGKVPQAKMGMPGTRRWRDAASCAAMLLRLGADAGAVSLDGCTPATLAARAIKAHSPQEASNLAAILANEAEAMRQRMQQQYQEQSGEEDILRL